MRVAGAAVVDVRGCDPYAAGVVGGFFNALVGYDVFVAVEAG